MDEKQKRVVTAAPSREAPQIAAYHATPSTRKVAMTPLLLELVLGVSPSMRRRVKRGYTGTPSKME
jgi:hypothetical protein